MPRIQLQLTIQDSPTRFNKLWTSASDPSCGGSKMECIMISLRRLVSVTHRGMSRLSDRRFITPCCIVFENQLTQHTHELLFQVLTDSCHCCISSGSRCGDSKQLQSPFSADPRHRRIVANQPLSLRPAPRHCESSFCDSSVWSRCFFLFLQAVDLEQPIALAILWNDSGASPSRREMISCDSSSVSRL